MPGWLPVLTTDGITSAHAPITMRVLLVEQNQSNRRSMSLVLREMGYRVSAVEDPSQVCETLNSEWTEILILGGSLSAFHANRLMAEIEELFGEVPSSFVQLGYGTRTFESALAG